MVEYVREMTSKKTVSMANMDHLALILLFVNITLWFMYLTMFERIYFEWKIAISIEKKCEHLFRPSWFDWPPVASHLTCYFISLFILIEIE